VGCIREALGSAPILQERHDATKVLLGERLLTSECEFQMRHRGWFRLHSAANAFLYAPLDGEASRSASERWKDGAMVDITKK
jgi:hypothetical protein